MNIRIVAIIIAIAALVGILFLLPDISPLCKLMYNGIESDLEKANYCAEDSDCSVIMLGGSYIEFGCYHFINKNVDKNLFYDKMKEYVKFCSRMIDMCARAPNATCVSGKCVAVEISR